MTPPHFNMEKRNKEMYKDITEALSSNNTASKLKKLSITTNDWLSVFHIGNTGNLIDSLKHNCMDIKTLKAILSNYDKLKSPNLSSTFITIIEIFKFYNSKGVKVYGKVGPLLAKTIKNINGLNIAKKDFLPYANQYWNDKDRWIEQLIVISCLAELRVGKNEIIPIIEDWLNYNNLLDWVRKILIKARAKLN